MSTWTDDWNLEKGKFPKAKVGDTFGRLFDPLDKHRSKDTKQKEVLSSPEKLLKKK